jgi:hypothetical protein
MSPAQVAESEPNWKLDEYGDKVGNLRDTVAGVDSDLSFFFKDDKLHDVFFSPHAETRDSVEDAFYSWYSSLNKRYGIGYIFVDFEHVGKAVDSKTLQTRVALFFKENISFDIQFRASERTNINLTAYYYLKRGHTKGHYVSMHFKQQEADNF